MIVTIHRQSLSRETWTFRLALGNALPCFDNHSGVSKLLQGYPSRTHLVLDITNGKTYGLE